jgi:MoxR-like ATPase
MRGNYHVGYDDIRALVLPVLRHRVLTNFHAESDSISVDEILRKLLDALPAPRD